MITIGERRLADELVKWDKSLYDNDQFGFIDLDHRFGHIIMTAVFPPLQWPKR
jgi:hypothetical protein